MLYIAYGVLKILWERTYRIRTHREEANEEEHAEEEELRMDTKDGILQDCLHIT